jgi:hypothetical protein
MIGSDMAAQFGGGFNTGAINAAVQSTATQDAVISTLAQQAGDVASASALGRPVLSAPTESMWSGYNDMLREIAKQRNSEDVAHRPIVEEDARTVVNDSRPDGAQHLASTATGGSEMSRYAEVTGFQQLNTAVLDQAVRGFNPEGVSGALSSAVTDVQAADYHNAMRFVAQSV